MSSELRSLHLVEFYSGIGVHWALFLPNRDGGHIGTLMHLRTRGPTYSFPGAQSWISQIENFQLRRSTARRCINLNGARCASWQLYWAAHRAFDDEFRNFNAFTRNCQVFIYRILQILNNHYPEQVGPDVLELVSDHGTIFTTFDQVMHRYHALHPNSNPPSAGRSGPHLHWLACFA